jgi:hypothetical protein
MDLSILEALGWRDAVIVVVVVIAIYMLISVLRLLQFRHHSAPTPMPTVRPPPQEPVVFNPEPEHDEPLLGDAVTISPEFAALLPASPKHAAPKWEVRDESPRQETPEPVERVCRIEPEFRAPPQRSGVEAELQYLRGDLARLSDQIAEVRDDVELLKASRNVSPLYSEAMGLAQQGHDARSIAGRCGISVGEADLVVALSRKTGGFDASEEREDADGRASADDPRR